MISVPEALNYIHQHQKNFGIEKVGLLQSLGRILASEVKADRDFPPFNRVTMDGIAINSREFEAGRRSFYIEKMQAAGHPLQQLDNESNCIEVMTGAILPENTDAVIPYEACEISNGVAIVQTDEIPIFQNIHLQGIDCKKGMRLIGKGTKITPSHIGILASVGTFKVPVFRLPSVAVCSTGDELVEVDQTPLSYQVRKSNLYMLAAALMADGIQPQTHHLPDNKKLMMSEIATLIKKVDVILFSGAVSKGKFDYLPDVLKELGMKTIFHRVAQKPGKPLLFGTFENGTLVFGLPGNPASSLVCYHVFFKAWLHSSLNYEAKKQVAKLADKISFKPKLSYHVLVSLSGRKGFLEAVPIIGSNSGDMPSLIHANGILTLPPDRELFEQGEVFIVIDC